MTDAETPQGSKSNATKEEVLELMEKRKALEEELLAWNSILESEGGVGMHGPLVDSEDYPRNDIDVAKVREARHKVKSKQAFKVNCCIMQLSQTRTKIALSKTILSLLLGHCLTK